MAANAPNADGLISVLFDPTARPDEQDDALMDLSECIGDEPRAIAALLRFACDPNADEMLQSSAGGSLGQIWKRLGKFDEDALHKLTSIAKTEANAYND